ncbi:MAG: DUF805 domain-containing protein [Methylophilus sp.]|jgi:uncharacterized membrane protein YhaH (DUF805 family)
MSFVDAVKLCFTKYADFNGRAKRPELWWFFLFCILVSLALEAVSGGLSWIFSLATLVPSLAVGARRLHDINKTGWLQLLGLIPVLGWIALIYFFTKEGDAGDNQFGAPPAN